MKGKFFFLSCFLTKTWNKFLCSTLFHFDFYEYNSITCLVRYWKCPLMRRYFTIFSNSVFAFSRFPDIVNYLNLNNIHLKEEILVSILEFRKKKIICKFLFLDEASISMTNKRMFSHFLRHFIEMSFEYRSNNTCPNIISIYHMLYDLDRKFTGYSRCCYLIIIGGSYDNIL